MGNDLIQAHSHLSDDVKKLLRFMDRLSEGIEIHEGTLSDRDLVSLCENNAVTLKDILSEGIFGPNPTYDMEAEMRFLEQYQKHARLDSKTEKYVKLGKSGRRSLQKQCDRYMLFTRVGESYDSLKPRVGAFGDKAKERRLVAEFSRSLKELQDRLEFALKLWQVMADMEINQKELAELVGVSGPDLTKYLNCSMGLPTETERIRQFSERLRIHASTLFKGKYGTKMLLPANFRKLLGAVKDLDTADITEVTEYAQQLTAKEPRKPEEIGQKVYILVPANFPQELLEAVKDLDTANITKAIEYAKQFTAEKPRRLDDESCLAKIPELLEAVKDLDTADITKVIEYAKQLTSEKPRKPEEIRKKVLKGDIPFVAKIPELLEAVKDLDIVDITEVIEHARRTRKRRRRLIEPLEDPNANSPV
jgi:uncharacterized protein (DUF433 family)